MTAILIYTTSLIWGAGLSKLRQISILPILAIAVAMIVAITSVASPLLQNQVAALLIGMGSNQSTHTLETALETAMATSLETALQASALGLLYGLCLRFILLTVDFVVHFVSSTLAVEYLTGSYSVARSGSPSSTQRSQSTSESDEKSYEMGGMDKLPQSWSMLLLLIVISSLLMSGFLHRLISETIRGSHRLATLADNPFSPELCLDTAKTVLSGMMESALSISLIFILPLVVFSVVFDSAFLVLQRLSFSNWDFSFLRTLKMPFVVVISYLTVSLLGEELVTLVMLGTTTGG